MASADKEWDVLVIGAGISGLNAARLLHEQGLKVVVLEGRDRIAGRQWTYRDASVDYLDMGGAYIGKQQTAILALMRELNLETYPLRTDQESTLSLVSGRQRFKSGMPLFWNPLVLLDLNNLIREIDRLSLEIPHEAPWTHPKAEEWDNMSMQDFLDKTMWTTTGRLMAGIMIEAPMVAEAKDISLLYFLWEIQGDGGIEAALTVENGLQEFKVKNGSGSISEKLYERLPAGTVHLNTRVSEVSQQEDWIMVTTQDHKQYKTKRVISTAPVPGLMNIHFSPDLPLATKKYAEIDVAAHAIKTFMIYETQFWCDMGLNGELVSEEGLVSVCIDDTKPDGSRPAIVGFVNNRNAQRLKNLSQEERKRVISAQYAADFGLVEFLEPVAYMDKDWSDKEESLLGRNCCIWSLPPGALTSIKALPEQDFGNVYFAGTEFTLTMKGYMDGAVRSSISTAAKVCESLGLDPSVIMTPERQMTSPLCQDIPYLPSSWISRILPNVPQFVISGSIIISAVTAATVAAFWGA